MNFNSNKPIYLQIVDNVCEKVLNGSLEAGSRVPSVREYGAELGVNPNTIVRSYEELTDLGIIYNRRGIGYFITLDAKNVVLEQQRSRFLEDELPRILKQAELLGIDLKQLI